MIPKKIHYCWFGLKPLPDTVKNYIESWREYMPDFDIKQWDETNFDIDSIEYVRQAYFAKRYAFVSDVARLYALITEGGVYFDTDVFVKKRFPDEWFGYRAFTSFEHDHYIQTGILASEPHNPIFEEFYNNYKTLRFFNGLKYDMTTNVYRMTELMQKHGFVMNNVKQNRDGFVVFPQIMLSAKNWKAGRYDTDETFAIHDFAGSWGQDVLSRKFYFYMDMWITVLKWYAGKILE